LSFAVNGVSIKKKKRCTITISGKKKGRILKWQSEKEISARRKSKQKRSSHKHTPQGKAQLQH